MTDHRRIQLDTKIEKEVHRMVQGISEGAYDRLQIYARRNNLEIDLDTLGHLMNTMKVVITELEMNAMDSFHSNIKKELDGYVGEENPTVSHPKAGGKDLQNTMKVAPVVSESPKKRKSVTLSI